MKASSDVKSIRSQTISGQDYSSGTLTNADLKILKAAFPREKLGVKVQTLNKEKTRALLVLYLQHTDVQDRLEEVDPSWSTEVLSEERFEDSIYVRLRLTVKGVGRENVGEGNDPKGAYSDALKRCAMLFGVGRYLYESSTVWVDYQESRDRYRQWSVDDYEAGLQKELPRVGHSRDNTSEKSIRPAEAKKPAVRQREQLNKVLMNLYRPYLMRFPETKFVEFLNSRYGVSETRLMTVEQIEDLVQYMENQLNSAA